MSIRKDTIDLLKTGKAKAKTRLKVVMKHFKHAVKTQELLKTGHAKKKARGKIVRNYFSEFGQPY